ncbi:GntR family transcriptional regulator [Streptomyces sp. NPDC003016]
MPSSGSAASRGCSCDPAPELSGVRRLSGPDAVRARTAPAVVLVLLMPGERLPGTAHIATALGVAEITVRRAPVPLCADGVLEHRRGRGGGTGGTPATRPPGIRLRAPSSPPAPTARTRRRCTG